MPNFIYSLADPRTGDVRYIGKSIDPPGRLKAHLCTARNRTYRHHTANWIWSLLKIGKEPILAVIEEVPQGRSWQGAEKQAIAVARASGARLTNSTRGGDGHDGSMPQVQAAKSRAMKRHWQRPEYREIIVAARNDPRFTKEQGDRLRHRWQSSRHREKMTGSRWTVEKRREQAARIAARNRTPDPEMVKRRNASIKAAWARRKEQSNV